MNKNILPIFFAVDDGYIPFLGVTLKSLVDTSSTDNYYLIKILYTSINEENKERIKKYERENINIEFVDLSSYIEKVTEKLHTRDYYSKTTYFRLFIPDLYTQYDKVLYLDSDIVIREDVANLYNIDLGNNLVAGAPDEAVNAIKEFREYVEKVVGVASYNNYFNAGVLLMNLKELREFKFKEKFLYSLSKTTFSVDQDQGYLNRICKGRVKIIDSSWNRMPINEKNLDSTELKLIHYNLAYKPWHFENIPYKDFFWNCAKETEYFNEIIDIRDNYTEEERTMDMKKNEELIKLAKLEADCVGDDRMYRG